MDSYNQVRITIYTSAVYLKNTFSGSCIAVEHLNELRPFVDWKFES